MGWGVHWGPLGTDGPLAGDSVRVERGGSKATNASVGERGAWPAVPELEREAVHHGQ
jgi:hypothetical protein